MKAVLVLDKMPDSCDNCRLYFFASCKAERRDLKFEEILNAPKPSWCPLRPLPKEIEDADYNDYQFGFQQGFNTCLEMIKGETE